MKPRIIIYLLLFSLVSGCTPEPSRRSRRHLLVGSTVHAALLYELGASSQIAGLLDTPYIIDSALRADIADGTLLDFGTTQSPNAEKILSSGIDTMMLSYIPGHDYGALSHLSIPIIECPDYLETSPLERARWMIFYGELVGRKQQADSLFQLVADNYQRLSRRAQSSTNRPLSLLTDLPQGDVWYVPSDSSYLAALYRDAGYLLPCSTGSTAKGSIALTIEQVISRGRDADVWFIKYASPEDITYESLLREHPYISLFKAFKMRHIYGCNTLRIPYYEEVPFHPDRLLQDLIDHSGRYFTPLQ